MLSIHAFLESKRDFSTWIKDSIEKYGFIENQYFTSFHKDMKREIVGGTSQVQYALNMDMAKELVMVEGIHKGKMVRHISKFM